MEIVLRGATVSDVRDSHDIISCEPLAIRVVYRMGAPDLDGFVAFCDGVGSKTPLSLGGCGPPIKISRPHHVPIEIERQILGYPRHVPHESAVTVDDLVQRAPIDVIRLSRQAAPTLSSASTKR